MVRGSLAVVSAFLALGWVTEALADGEEAAWAALERGGHVVIMRHADAPGPQQGREGDPSGFRLDDCSTQRNLDDFGREQAKEIGNMIRAHRVTFSRVVASPWCRAKDTATLMNLGPQLEVSHLLRNLGEHEGNAGELNKEFEEEAEHNARGEKSGEGNAWMAQNRGSMIQVRRMVGQWEGPGNMMLVSHGRTVIAVVFGDRRMSPSQGTLYVLQPTPGNRPPFRVVGSIPAPQ